MCSPSDQLAWFALLMLFTLVAAILISELRRFGDYLATCRYTKKAEELSNRAPAAEGYCVIPQYQVHARHDARGKLCLKMVITHYRYFNDGREIPPPFEGM